MQQVSIRLPENIYQTIKNNAKKQRRSINSEIVKMLDDYFAVPSTTDQAAVLRQEVEAHNGNS